MIITKRPLAPPRFMLAGLGVLLACAVVLPALLDSSPARAASSDFLDLGSVTPVDAGTSNVPIQFGMTNTSGRQIDVLSVGVTVTAPSHTKFTGSGGSQQQMPFFYRNGTGVATWGTRACTIRADRTSMRCDGTLPGTYYAGQVNWFTAAVDIDRDAPPGTTVRDGTATITNNSASGSTTVPLSLGVVFGVSGKSNSGTAASFIDQARVTQVDAGSKGVPLSIGVVNASNDALSVSSFSLQLTAPSHTLFSGAAGTTQTVPYFYQQADLVFTWGVRNCTVSGDRRSLTCAATTAGTYMPWQINWFQALIDVDQDAPKDGLFRDGSAQIVNSPFWGGSPYTVQASMGILVRSGTTVDSPWSTGPFPLLVGILGALGCTAAVIVTAGRKRSKADTRAS